AGYCEDGDRYRQERDDDEHRPLDRLPDLIRDLSHAAIREFGGYAGLGARHGSLRDRRKPISTACVSTSAIHASTPPNVRRASGYRGRHGNAHPANVALVISTRCPSGSTTTMRMP